MNSTKSGHNATSLHECGLCMICTLGITALQLMQKFPGRVLLRFQLSGREIS